MRVAPANLLWRTRGRTWDYTFVLRPIEPPRKQWYDTYRLLFDALTPTTPEQPHVTRHGLIGFTPYLATTFCDREARDEAGRPIVHAIAWFPGSFPPGLPVDWGQQVVDTLADDLYGDAAPPGPDRFTRENAIDLKGEAVALDPATYRVVAPAAAAKLTRNVPTILLIGAIFATMTAALCNWLR